MYVCMLAQVHNPSPWKAEAGKLPVQGQTGLQCDILFQKTNKKRKKASGNVY